MLAVFSILNFRLEFSAKNLAENGQIGPKIATFFFYNLKKTPFLCKILYNLEKLDMLRSTQEFIAAVPHCASCAFRSLAVQVVAGFGVPDGIQF